MKCYGANVFFKADRGIVCLNRNTTDLPEVFYGCKGHEEWFAQYILQANAI